MARGDDADIAALLGEFVAGAVVAAGLDRRLLVVHGQRFQVSHCEDVVPVGETADAGLVADDAEIDLHFLQQIVQVFHDEDRTRDSGNVLAEFVGAPGFGLEDREMSRKEIDIDDAEVVFEGDAAMGSHRPCLARGEQAGENRNDQQSSHRPAAGNPLTRE